MRRGQRTFRPNSKEDRHITCSNGVNRINEVGVRRARWALSVPVIPFSHITSHSGQLSFLPSAVQGEVAAGKVTVCLLVAAATHHRRSYISTYGLNGFRNRDEQPAYIPVGAWYPRRFIAIIQRVKEKMLILCFIVLPGSSEPLRKKEKGRVII